jgi:hypothetical protein
VRIAGAPSNEADKTRSLQLKNSKLKTETYPPLVIHEVGGFATGTNKSPVSRSGMTSTGYSEEFYFLLQEGFACQKG